MESVIAIMALLFGGIALWGAIGMLQVYRKKNELNDGGDGKVAEGSAVRWG